MPRSEEIREQMRKNVNKIYQSGKFWDTNYPQKLKTWNSGEPSLEWQADQNYPKGAATTHPRGHKRPHNDIQKTHLPQLRSAFKQPGKNGLRGRAPSKTTCEQQEQ